MGKIEVPQSYIDAHVAVCNVKPRPRHYGLASRKRQCAISLYKYCIKLGIEPVIHNADLPKYQDKLNQRKAD